MGKLEGKSIESPDENRTFDKGSMAVVKVGDVVFGRATFEPGWRWSECVKPIAGTDSCEVHHNGFIVSGRMHIRMNDGQEAEFGPGDVFVAPPGHDGWVVGDETCVALDFAGGAAIYAKE